MLILRKFFILTFLLVPVVAEAQSFYEGHLESLKGDKVIVSARGVQDSYELLMVNQEFYKKIKLLRSTALKLKREHESQLAQAQKKLEKLHKNNEGGAVSFPDPPPEEGELNPISREEFFKLLKEAQSKNKKPELEVYGFVDGKNKIVRAQHVVITVEK